MKLQISFDLTDLEAALAIAHEVQGHTDIMDIGPVLLYKYGHDVVRRFKDTFPQKTILADAKITDQSRELVQLFAQAGADWITVMAGSGRAVIHTACTVAHELGKKIMLDLLDASSPGQAALEAKSLGVDAILFHKPLDEDQHMPFLERWDMVKGNTTLPVYIAAGVTRQNIAEYLPTGATGIVIGKAITHAEQPAQEAAYFASILP
jgi:3-keto-L-gulonate-6-phosphate decarboxylase